MVVGTSKPAFRSQETVRATPPPTDRLKDFLTNWCNADADIGDVTRLLRKYPDYGFSLWLEDELRQAIRNREIFPELAEALTAIGFDDQAEVDAWLHDLWTTWFPNSAYPDGRDH